MARLIIFDMDGTLYDINDVMGAVYDTQVSFLRESMGWAETKAIQFLNDNEIKPHVTKDSKSATALFVKMGLGREEWTEYRQRRFPIDRIDPSRAATADQMKRFAILGDVVLLTSNTSQVCGKILARIDIAQNLFKAIVCSDTTGEDAPFDKYREMKKLIDVKTYDSIISIGDRYQTDIVPALKLGGYGCLVKAYSSIEKVCEDLESGRMVDCPDYEYFQEGE